MMIIKSFARPPQLEDHLLYKVFPITGTAAIGIGDLIKDALVFFDQSQKIGLVHTLLFVKRSLKSQPREKKFYLAGTDGRDKNDHQRVDRRIVVSPSIFRRFVSAKIKRSTH